NLLKHVLNLTLTIIPPKETLFKNNSEASFTEEPVNLDWPKISVI
ncbi:MAG: hypothetical protein ACD_79C00183G0001, partial [uncultured bacterium]